MAFKDTYLSPPKNNFTGYSGATTPRLLSHLYINYTRILAPELAENYKNLRKIYNPNEPPESLYMRLNKCADYATVSGKPIT